jgi:predicted dehydrogenase
VSGRPVRLGLVGAGRWGRNIIRTIREGEGAVLARVASANPETAGLAGPDCVISADWRAVVQDPTLDGVVLAAPPRAQPGIAQAVIAAGRPVMVEKPLALSLAEAEGLAEMSAAAGVPVLVDHVYLFHPAWRELVRRARSAGPLHRIRATGGNTGPFRDDFPVLWDWAPHDLSLCLDLAGAPPTRAAARLVRRERTPRGVGEIYVLDLDFSGAVAAIEIGNVMPARVRRFAAEFAETTLVFDDTAAHPLTQAGAPIAVAARPPLACAIDAFVESISSGVRSHPSLALGVEVVRTISRCEVSLGGA